MDTFIYTFFNLDIMAQALPLLLKGAVTTLQLCAVVIVAGLAGGLALALAALSRNAVLHWSAVVFIDLFRALPPLVLLVFVYSGLPFAGLRLSPFMAVVIAFFLSRRLKVSVRMPSSLCCRMSLMGCLRVGDGALENKKRGCGQDGSPVSQARAWGHSGLPQEARKKSKCPTRRTPWSRGRSLTCVCGAWV